MKNITTFKIFGRQPVIEVLRSDYQIIQIKIARESNDKQIKKIFGMAQRREIKIVKVPKNDLQKDVGAVVHQGVIAETEPFKLLSDTSFNTLLKSTEKPFLLALDQIQDPHNLGAIIRTAESAGVTALIIPEKGSAAINSTVAKTSAGALFHLAVYQSTQFEMLLEEFNQKNILTISTTPAAQDSLYETDLKQGICLIVGSEGKGVRKNILRLCKQHIRLPQLGKVSSLNASVATAIVLYEAVRQRKL